ncbi:MAG: NADH:flavin oxidoreductase [Hyphomonadaceae bacterium]|nr:NADH:flavin oxidoreductase [Hyphomonadaceae bacterium]
MWKPAERIRHTTLIENWPSATEAARSTLFSPFKSGRLELSSRTWIPAMVPWRATPDGEVTSDVVDWYSRFAQAAPGAIVIEATGIRDVPSGPLLRIGHDRYIPGLKRVVEAVREASNGQTRVFIQLIDFLSIRRRPDRQKYFERFLQITDSHRQALQLPDADDAEIRTLLSRMGDEPLKRVLSEREWESLSRGHRERVTDTEIPDIRSLPEVLPGLFRDAAVRAQSAGFDGVELHYAHAYTMASFLSRRNTRSDGYGGRLENRIRLPKEVFSEVRRHVRPEFVVGCRILAEECIEGGSTVEDTEFFSRQLAEAGIDFISLSRGGKFEDAAEPKVGDAIYPYTGQSGYECMPQIISDQKGPFGRNVPATSQIKQHLSDHDLATPVVVAGGMHAFSQAERLLVEGQADLIGFARQALADPDWFSKVRLGRGEKVNLCKYTNYCEGLDQKHKMVTCQLWDRTDLDASDAKRTPDGKRRTTAPQWKNDEII